MTFANGVHAYISRYRCEYRMTRYSVLTSFVNVIVNFHDLKDWTSSVNLSVNYYDGGYINCNIKKYDNNRVRYITSVISRLLHRSSICFDTVILGKREAGWLLLAGPGIQGSSP